MMTKLIKKTILIIFLLTSAANAGITKFGAGFSQNFEDYKDFKYADSQNYEDDFRTINLNVTHFFNNGLNLSIGSNRLINHKSKRKAIQSGQEFNYDYQSFVDTFMIGYKIKRLNTSLVLANVTLKSRAYNEYFDKQSKISAIIPAINFSYQIASFKGVNVVPSLSFYWSKELGITKGVLANINFMF
jgi:hypothetical protein